MASVLCHLVLTQLSALIKPSAGTHLGLSDLSWGITWSAPVLWEIRWVFLHLKGFLLYKVLYWEEDFLWLLKVTLVFGAHRQLLTLLRWKVLGESCCWFQLGSGTGLSECHPAWDEAEGQDFPAEGQWLLSRLLVKVWLRASAWITKLGVFLCWRGLLSQTSSPGWLFLPSGISLAPGTVDGPHGDLGFLCVRLALQSSHCVHLLRGFVPVPFPPWELVWREALGRFQTSQLPGRGCSWAGGLWPCLPGQKDGGLHLSASRRGITAAILAGVLLLS